MTEEMLLHFREILIGRLDLIQPGIRELRSTLRDSSEYEEPMDVMDLTANRSSRELKLEIHRRDRQMVSEIHGALKRILTGTFGVCEECGDDIGVERLRAQPFTRLCVECRRKMESFGHLKVA